MDKVIACKHLSYDETKYTKDCSISGLGSDKAVWERNGPNGFQLCQFCELRGRINSADGCTSRDKAHCNEYEDFEHSLVFRN
jgi:hypothetical protein